MKVVQCWDDGVHDDIRLIEILRKYGAKASFNLNFAKHSSARTSGWKYKDTKEVWKLAKSELRDVYEGFLVANHTSTHPFLTRIPIAEAKREVCEGRDALEQHFGYGVTGFAYPFGDFNPAVEEVVQEAGHLYARTTRRAHPVYPPTDAMAFHPSCHFLDPEFWSVFERIEAEDGVFYFWGHSYELVTEVEWQDFEEKIARIDSTPSAIWCDLPELFLSGRVQG